MTYALALIESANGPLPVVEIGDESYPLAAIWPGLPRTDRDLLYALEHWDDVLRAIDEAVAAGTLPSAIPGARAMPGLAPITRPANIICAGSNYYDHLAKDFGVTAFDKAANDILYFTKQPGSIVGPGKTVRYPSQSAAFDWEIELVVVIGKAGRRIRQSDAMRFVAGYSIGIDLTARDLQFNKRQRRQFDLFAGKAFDDSAPLGPRIVPARFIDPADLALTLSVNGAVRQESSTREMIWNVAELIADVSQHVTLRPGDLLFTGSPAGIGHVTGNYLEVGDRIQAWIEHLGTLEVEIVADPDAARVRERPEPAA